MNCTCYAVDDENHALELLYEYITQTPGLQLLGLEGNPVKAFNYLSNAVPKPDIVFLDIDMPKLTGIELAELIGDRSLIIFVTASSNYAVKAFDQNAVDYILKPISYERFLKSIDRAQAKLADKNVKWRDTDTSFFFIKTGTKGKFAQVPMGDVEYIEANGNYVNIFLESSYYPTYLSITEIEEKLPAGKFIRCHKSYIVNLEKIKIVDHVTIELLNGKHIQVGSGYRQKLLERVQKNLFKSKRL